MVSCGFHTRPASKRGTKDLACMPGWDSHVLETVQGLLFRRIDPNQAGELTNGKDLHQRPAHPTNGEPAARVLDLLMERNELAHEGSAHPLDASQIEQHFSAAGLIHQAKELLPCFLDCVVVQDAA